MRIIIIIIVGCRAADATQNQGTSETAATRRHGGWREGRDELVSDRRAQTTLHPSSQATRNSCMHLCDMQNQAQSTMSSHKRARQEDTTRTAAAAEHKEQPAGPTQPGGLPDSPAHKTQRIERHGKQRAAQNSNTASSSGSTAIDALAAAGLDATVIAGMCDSASSVISARGASAATAAACTSPSSIAAAAVTAVAAAAAPSSSPPFFVFDEAARMAALRSYSIMHTPPESQFDELVKLAADICQCPVTLISLVGEDSQWYKSKCGSDAEGTPRSVAFCDIAIRNPGELMQVEDALADPRFVNNPLVIGPPHIRFYCGAPLIDTETGQALGTMCAIDFVPRKLNDLQKVSLKLLSRQVMAAFESRRRIQKLQSALQQLEETRNALKASKEQAEHAVVLAEQANHAKSEFLANMSHEIRTPLNGVLGTASLLAETTRLDFEQKDYVRVIQSSGEHLLIVLNDILDFSKFESGKLEIDAGRVDLQSMLEQAIELSFKPKPTLELVYEIGSDVPPTILGDVTRLRQIVANLISNASKFTSEGQIEIRVERMSVREIALQQQAQMQVATLNYSAAQQSSAGAGSTMAAEGSSASPARDGTASAPSEASADTSPSGLGSPPPPVLGSVVPAVSANLVAPTAVSPIQLSQIPGGDFAAAAPAAPVAMVSDDSSSSSASLTSPPSVGFSPFVAPLIPPLVHEASLGSEENESMMLVLSVSDTGIGIDANKIHKLFSAFTQLDVSITREYGGTGLGLAISARLAQLMGGTMWVKSEVGKGSTFFCSIRTQAWHGRCNSGSSSPSHANSPLPAAHSLTPTAAHASVPQRSPLWLSSSHAHSNSMTDSPLGSTESSVPPRLQLRHQSSISRSRELSPREMHRDRSGSVDNKFAAFDAEVSAVTSQPETATQRIAYSFPAFAYAAASPALVAHTQQRTHAVVIESNAFLLRSLSSQLQRWGFIPHSFSSIAAAEELFANADMRKRIAVLIVSHEKALTGDAEGGDAYAFIERLRKMDGRIMTHDAAAPDAATTACAIEVDETPSATPAASSSSSAPATPPSPTAATSSSAAAAAAGAPAASAATPLVYIIPAIVLLPSKVMDEGNPQTPPVTDINLFCTTLRKPVLHSKLQSLLNKRFQIALFGSQYPAHNYSPALTPLQLPQTHRSNSGSSSSHSNSPQRGRSPLPRGALPGSLKSDPISQASTHRPAQPSSRAKPAIDAALMRSLDLDNDVSADPMLAALLPVAAGEPAAAPLVRPTTALEVAGASNGRSIPAAAAAAASSSSSSSSAAAAAPASSSAVASSASSATSSSSRRSSGGSKLLRVLCVEDNVINMKLVVKMLNSCGFTNVAQGQTPDTRAPADGSRRERERERVRA